MKFIPFLSDGTVNQMYHILIRAQEVISQGTPKYEVDIRDSKVHGGNLNSLAEIMQRCGLLEFIGEYRSEPDLEQRFALKYYAWNRYRVTSLGSEFIEKSLSFEKFCQIVRKEQWKYFAGFSGGRPEMMHWVIVTLVLGLLFK